MGVVLFPVDVDRPLGSHVALDRPDGSIGVGDGLALGRVTDDDFAVLLEADDRRSGPGSFRVGDDDRFSGLVDRDDGVGGAEVDSDCLRHDLLAP